jgi:hypothetical protein
LADNSNIDVEQYIKIQEKEESQGFRIYMMGEYIDEEIQGEGLYS